MLSETCEACVGECLTEHLTVALVSILNVRLAEMKRCNLVLNKPFFHRLAVSKQHNILELSIFETPFESMVSRQ